MGKPFSDILYLYILYMPHCCVENQVHTRTYYFSVLLTKTAKLQQMVPSPRNSVPVPLDERPIQVSTAMIAKVSFYGAVHKAPPLANRWYLLSESFLIANDRRFTTPLPANLFANYPHLNPRRETLCTVRIRNATS
jgi:hypothetical protein